MYIYIYIYIYIYLYILYGGVLESFLRKRRLLLKRERKGERERLGEMYVHEERGRKRAKHSVSSKKGRGNIGHKDNIILIIMINNNYYNYNYYIIPNHYHNLYT